MTVAARDIAAAAIDAVVEELKRRGLPSDHYSVQRAFLDVLGERIGIVEAVLITPSGDAGSMKASVQQALEKQLNRTVILSERADPGLLGGAVLQVGDERIDVSLRGSLDALAHDLRTTGVAR